jgi:cell wall-associated NlpC family hydrolase
MAETTTAGATPADPGATPGQTPGDQQPAMGESEPTLGDAGKRAIDAERTARRDAEQRAKAAEEELKKLRDASLSDSERRDKRLAELERAQASFEIERQDWRLRDAVTRTAMRLGYADPTDAVALVDRAAVEFDDAGSPKNVDRLLTDLLKAKPHLAGGTRPFGSFDGGARGQPVTGKDMNTLLRQAAGRT